MDLKPGHLSYQRRSELGMIAEQPAPAGRASYFIGVVAEDKVVALQLGSDRLKSCSGGIAAVLGIGRSAP
jgi:hypothetical protein